MLMLMLNLIKLQHALGASIPNCVTYSKYIAQKYILVIRTNHAMYVLCFTFFLQFYEQFVSQGFIELAVKQVQFEHVNTGSFFSWLWR